MAIRPSQAERLAALEKQFAEAQVSLLELQSNAVTEDDLKSQNKVVTDLAAKVRALMAKLGIVDAPVAPQPPVVKPTPQPPDPAGSAPQIQRGRADVTRILLEELAKQTSFIPGNGDVTSPTSAIQLHTTDVIQKLNALQVNEQALRTQIQARWEMEVQKYKWNENYPPKGQATVIPSNPAASAPVPVQGQPAAPEIIAPTTNPNGRWTKEMIDRAVRQITTPNQGRAIAIPDKEGWYRQGSIVMGVPPKDDGRPSWAPNSNAPDSTYWPFINIWFVAFREIGDPGGGVIQFRAATDMFFEDDWYLIKPPSNRLGWGAYYHEEFRYQGRDFTDHNGKFTESGLYNDEGSFSVEVKPGTAPHFMCDSGLVHVPRIGQLKGYLATVWARLDPQRSNPNAKVLLQVGADAKPTTGSSSQNGVDWYPGVGVASMQRVTKEWEQYSMLTVQGAGVAYRDARVLTLDQLYAKPPLLS